MPEANARFDLLNLTSITMRQTWPLGVDRWAHRGPLRLGFAWRTGLVFALWLLAVVGVEAQGLVINEVVTANATGAVDADGDRPDWVELYNPGTAAVNLAGFGLSDDAKDPFKWRFPLRVVAARGFFRLFASGKDLTNTSVLHTNFKLSSAGETLVLTRPDGRTLDSVRIPRMEEDLAYGRLPDGEGNWFFLAAPTPLAANRGPGATDWLEAPKFSHAPGAHAGAFDLGVVSASPGARVHYTLDGAEPTQASPVYTAPLTILDRSLDLDVLALIPNTSTNNQHTDGWKPPLGKVRKVTVVRARAYETNAIPSRVATRTFWIGPTTNRALPMLSLVTPREELFDFQRGIYVLGQVFEQWRTAHPTEVLTGHTPANYTQRGPDWQRPASMEFFGTNGVLELAREVDLDIQGQSTRSFRQKPLGLKMRSGAIERALFPGLLRRGGGGELNWFKHLRLRNSGNDWAYTLFRDGLCHTLVQGLPIDSQAYRPVEVFLDGEYWGVHNLREQEDATYFEAHYGIPPSASVIASADGSLVEGSPGANASFVELRQYVQTHDLSDPVAYAEVGRRMDIDNFLLYHAVCIYFGNADWPHNNLRVWRDTRPVQPGGELRPTDGRWRWLLFDCDLTFAHPWTGGVSDETLAAAISPTGRAGLGDAGWSTLLLRGLLKNPEFQRAFLNTGADLMNSWFREGRVGATIDRLKAAIAPAMGEHLSRWRTLADTNQWNTQVRVLSNFASQRPTLLRQQYVAAFKLGGYARMTIGAPLSGAGRVRVNRLLVDASLPGASTEAYPWAGWYFRGVPVGLEAVPDPGYEFQGWVWTTEAGGTGRSEQARLEIEPQNAVLVRAAFARIRPRLSAKRGVGNQVVLEVFGAPGSQYSLEHSTNLKSWVTDSVTTTGSAGVVSVIRTNNDAGGMQFLRAVILGGNR